MQIDEVMQAVRQEVDKAEADWPRYASAHEAYAVLLEEVEEFWREVQTKQRARDPERLRREAVQIAAVAVRIVLSMSTSEAIRR